MSEDVHSPEWYRLQERVADAVGTGACGDQAIRSRVAVGDLLILRDEYQKLAQNPDAPCAAIRRATLLGSAIDELLDRREKEAQYAASAE